MNTKGLSKSIANSNNSTFSTRSFNNVDWSIVEKIIKNSQEKFEKEREFNIEGELNLMRILASYSNILELNDINPNQDMDYYNFFLTVSRYMLAHNMKDWMEGSAIILQNSKSISYSHSYENKSNNLDDSNQHLLPSNTHPKHYLKQYQGDNSFDNKSNNGETYNNDSYSYWLQNQKRSEDMIENNPYMQNKLDNKYQYNSLPNCKNEILPTTYHTSKEDRKKQKSYAQRSLMQTINNNLMSIENKLGDIEESQNNMTRINISDLDLSNISHSNNNTTLVSCLNLNNQYNSLKYVNQTKNELKTQFGFDNSFLEQALNQTTQDQTNASHWQQNTQYISIKEQDQEEDDEDEKQKMSKHSHNFEEDNEDNYDEEYNHNISQHTAQLTGDSRQSKYFHAEQRRSIQQKQIQSRDHNYTNSSYDNDLYTHIPQKDISINQINLDKFFSNQTLTSVQPSPLSHKPKNILQHFQNDSYSNKSFNNQIQNQIQTHPEQIGRGYNHVEQQPLFKQKLIQQNVKLNNTSLNNSSTSKLNLSNHLEKFNKYNNTSQTNLNKELQQNKLAQTISEPIDYIKPNKDSLQNSTLQQTLKGGSSIISFNPQKSQLLSSFEKQFQQFSRRPSNESNLSNTLGRSELNSYSLHQPVLLQSKSKHNVSFGENSVFQLDENELNFKIKSQNFIRWVQYVNARRQLKWEKDEQIRKFILALDYYSSMTQQKVIVLLKGYSMLMKERRKKIQYISKKCQNNFKLKYFQLYVLNYQLSQIEGKQNNKADKFATHAIKKKYLNLLKMYKNQQKAKKEKFPTKQICNRIFIEFILMLVLEKAPIDLSDKKEFWLRVKSYQSEKACSVLSKYQKQVCMSDKGINDKLKPHLDWLKFDSKQRLFQSLVNYKKFVTDSQSFRSCRLKFYLFQTWKNKYIKKREQENVLQQHFNVKYTQLLERMMTRWRDVTSKNSLLKQRYKYLKIQSKYNLLEKYFTKWSDKYEYYIQNKEEIIKGYQIKGYLTMKRIFQALVNFQKESKQKKEYYSYAFSHYSVALCKKVFRGYEMHHDKKLNYQQVVNSVDEYANSKCVKKVFKAWKKQTIQEKMVNNSIKQRLYTKVMKSLQSYTQRMRMLNSQVDQLIQRNQINNLTKGFKGFITNYIFNQEKLQKAFTHYYTRKMFTTLYHLHSYKERKQRKNIGVVEYIRNKKSRQVKKCFASWKMRTLVKQRSRIGNKVAVNNFIRILFKRMIQILRTNVEKRRQSFQINESIVQISKKRTFDIWRQAFVNKRCQDHYEKHTLYSILTHWKQYIEKKRFSLMKRREAGLLYQAKLMKIAIMFIQSLQVNKQKQIYKKAVHERVQSSYESKVKHKFLTALSQITKNVQDQKQKITKIAQNCSQQQIKKYFSLWQMQITRSNQKYSALSKIIEWKQYKQIKDSFDNWKHFIKLMQYDDALDSKSKNLRDYLQVKRFFATIKKRQIERQNECEKIKAANYYFKRCAFYKLINGFYNSIQEKKQKQISLKHYALKILANSFWIWKKYSKEKYERQFYKIMSSTKRDNLLDNSINNYISEDQQDNGYLQGNQLGLNILDNKSALLLENKNDNINQVSQTNDQINVKTNMLNNNYKEDYDLNVNNNNNNNLNNIFRNSAYGKQVSFSKTQQDDLLTNNLNYTGVQDDLSKYQFDGYSDEYQQN